MTFLHRKHTVDKGFDPKVFGTTYFPVRLWYREKYQEGILSDSMLSVRRKCGFRCSKMIAISWNLLERITKILLNQLEGGL